MEGEQGYPARNSSLPYINTIQERIMKNLGVEDTYVHVESSITGSKILSDAFKPFHDTVISSPEDKSAIEHHHTYVNSQTGGIRRKMDVAIDVGADNWARSAAMSNNLKKKSRSTKNPRIKNGPVDIDGQVNKVFGNQQTFGSAFSQYKSKSNAIHCDLLENPDFSKGSLFMSSPYNASHFSHNSSPSYGVQYPNKVKSSPRINISQHEFMRESGSIEGSPSKGYPGLDTKNAEFRHKNISILDQLVFSKLTPQTSPQNVGPNFNNHRNLAPNDQIGHNFLLKKIFSKIMSPYREPENSSGDALTFSDCFGVTSNISAIYKTLMVLFLVLNFLLSCLTTVSVSRIMSPSMNHSIDQRQFEHSRNTTIAFLFPIITAFCGMFALCSYCISLRSSVLSSISIFSFASILSGISMIISKNSNWLAFTTLVLVLIAMAQLYFTFFEFSLKNTTNLQSKNITNLAAITWFFSSALVLLLLQIFVSKSQKFNYIFLGSLQIFLLIFVIATISLGFHLLKRKRITEPSNPNTRESSCESASTLNEESKYFGYQQLPNPTVDLEIPPPAKSVPGSPDNSSRILIRLRHDSEHSRTVVPEHIRNPSTNSSFKPFIENPNYKRIGLFVALLLHLLASYLIITGIFIYYSNNNILNSLKYGYFSIVSAVALVISAASLVLTRRNLGTIHTSIKSIILTIAIILFLLAKSTPLLNFSTYLIALSLILVFADTISISASFARNWFGQDSCLLNYGLCFSIIALVMISIAPSQMSLLAYKSLISKHVSIVVSAILFLLSSALFSTLH
ncbi:hypothetical protein AYI68_g755 [Smittium mucronatum]|uniref:Uncharacterized protein n=1 Tax=Smittium mucronatum TaxID=133383 RepID=A0A1R0H7B2_9FUNG|nr:hypothetical protein AYI68_g755 [Smittium mucronatum]